MANMDVLVSVGTMTAYLYSVGSFIAAATNPSYDGEQYFETAALLITFVLLGKFLEANACGAS